MALNFQSGLAAGYADNLKREQIRDAKNKNWINEFNMQAEIDDDMWQEMVFAGAIEEDLTPGSLGWTINQKSDFWTPKKIRDYITAYSGEVNEYAVYDDKGVKTGFETGQLDKILGVPGPDGEMTYAMTVIDPEGKPSFWGRNRKKGEGKDPNNIRTLSANSFNLLLETSLDTHLSRTKKASALITGLAEARGPRVINNLLLTKERSTLGSLTKKAEKIKDLIEYSEENDRTKFIQTVTEMKNDPAFKGEPAFLDMLDEYANVWNVLNGDNITEVATENVSTTAEGEAEGTNQEEEASVAYDGSTRDFRSNLRPDKEMRASGTPEGVQTTNEVTQFNRPIYIGEDGVPYSEKTVTFQMSDGSWINMPSVGEGGYIEKDQAVLERYAEAELARTNKNDMIKEIRDPITGEEIKTYPSLEAAKAGAEFRSRILSGDGLTTAIKEKNPLKLEQQLIKGKIENAEDAIKMLSETLPETQVYEAMRLISAQTDDPTESFANLERIYRTRGTQFAKAADLDIEKGLPQKFAGQTQKGMVNMLASGYLGTITREDGTRSTGLIVTNADGEQEVRSYNQSLQSIRQTFNDLNSGKIDPRNMASVLQDTHTAISNVFATAATQEGKEDWLDRDEWFGDAWQDNLWFNERLDPALSTITNPGEGLMVIVGERSRLSVGPFKGKQVPRISLPDPSGKRESTASIDLRNIYRAFGPTGVKNTEAYLYSLVQGKPADKRQLDTWFATQNYASFVKTYAVGPTPTQAREAAKDIATKYENLVSPW